MRGVHLSLVCLSVLIFPEVSLAHSPIEGLGSFYNGLLHPVLVPAHLLLLIAVGFFLGQQGLERIELVLGTYSAATFSGLVLAWFSFGTVIEPFILVLSAIIGLLIAINPKIKIDWYILIAILSGFFLGLDSAQEQLFGKDKLASLLGSGIAIYFLVLYPMILADKLKEKAWTNIGIRIIGSWVAASSLLVLAFLVKSQA